jgi:uncharacterized protein YggT (Ycf19 family)
VNRVDLLLNLAGLLLWLGWRAVRLQAPVARPGAMAHLLKQADAPPSRRWTYLGVLVLLLALRAVFYWRVGSQVDWVPALDVGAINLPFNSVSLVRMALYSMLSFALVLAVFYMWLLLLSVVNRSLPDTDPWQRAVRRSLGWLDVLPAVIKVIAPVLVVGGLWWVANPWLARLGMTASPSSPAHLAQQSLLVGLGALLAWKYLLAGVLFLGVLNTYLYLGNWSLWSFVQATSRNLLAPLQVLPLRLGRVDFSPILGLALLWLVFTYAEFGLNYLFGRLPL